MEFGDAVEQLVAAGLRKAEIASALSVTPSTLSRMLRDGDEAARAARNAIPPPPAGEWAPALARLATDRSRALAAWSASALSAGDAATGP